MSKTVDPGGTRRLNEVRTLMGAPGAGWQSGYAADCKSVYAGSIPASASRFAVIWRLRSGAAPA